MLPRDLKAESFAGYPSQAKTLAVAYLDALRKLPLAFAPSLLRQLMDYDYSFPVERSVIDDEMRTLSSLSDSEHKDWFRDFSAISLSSSLENFDWINLPRQFVEQQAAYLWSTHQLDAFRKAALDYGDRLAKSRHVEPVAMQRLGIAVAGRGVATYDAPLFRKLRQHGTRFTQVNPDGALQTLLSAVEQRARNSSAAYAHWYVDGGAAMAHAPEIACISYESLAPLRGSILKKMQTEIGQPGMGPEELRTRLAKMTPADLGMGATDPVLSRFQMKLFTEGSGTQIYSTTFAQWTSREVLRRAQAVTLMVRYAPRQRQRPMNELLSGKQGEAELDPSGSLLDADMGAYYHWIDQQRLPDAEHSAFIAWFEGHGEGVAIGPAMPRGAESHAPIEMSKLLSLVTA
ncbi:hypothetical protein [Occallatibacter riparius]|uniref:Uncharacterized protein n=1 Tax=Occallatibacter riparius TaxID=1002689 RepID=A0A9J7BUN4_9BACT|nr:hypothetical protein [Occallatibacter riparius]UWZ86588.1 hypothetical protein MOP44_11730 [Occallatibacter riparius]